MNLLDILVGIILVVSVVLSVMKGFVREILGIISILAAFLLGSWLYTPAASLFKDVVKTENFALFLGFATVFLGTLLAGAAAIWVAQKILKFAKLQWFDRVLGAAFGFIRGWALGVIVFLVLTSFNLQAERVRTSQLAPYYLPGARVIALVTPYDLKSRFMAGFSVVQKWWVEHL